MHIRMYSIFDIKLEVWSKEFNANKYHLVLRFLGYKRAPNYLGYTKNEFYSTESLQIFVENYKKVNIIYKLIDFFSSKMANIGKFKYKI